MTAVLCSPSVIKTSELPTTQIASVWLGPQRARLASRIGNPLLAAQTFLARIRHQLQDIRCDGARPSIHGWSGREPLPEHDFLDTNRSSSSNSQDSFFSFKRQRERGRRRSGRRCAVFALLSKRTSIPGPANNPATSSIEISSRQWRRCKETTSLRSLSRAQSALRARPKRRKRAVQTMQQGRQTMPYHGPESQAAKEDGQQSFGAGEKN